MARDTNNSEKFARKKNTKKYEKRVQRPNFICRFHGSQPLERSFDSEKLRWKIEIAVLRLITAELQNRYNTENENLEVSSLTCSKIEVECFLPQD